MQKPTSSGRSSASLRNLKRELACGADAQRAETLQRFFKTSKGEYGEGDRFLGIPVPQQRKFALRYRALPLNDMAHLLTSPIHEYRFAALEILVAQFEGADPFAAGEDSCFLSAPCAQDQQLGSGGIERFPANERRLIRKGIFTAMAGNEGSQKTRRDVKEL